MSASTYDEWKRTDAFLEEEEWDDYKDRPCPRDKDGWIQISCEGPECIRCRECVAHCVCGGME